jgi:hypothetical protein
MYCLILETVYQSIFLIRTEKNIYVYIAVYEKNRKLGILQHALYL